MQRYISWLQHHYPDICYSMHSCWHNFSSSELNPYHLESDCWSHTMMVCKVAELEKSSRAVKVAALLHDIGKPLCREINPRNNHVRFFGHEGMSAYLSLEILQKMATEGLIEQKEISHIFALVALHAVPYKVDSEQKLIDKFRYTKQLFDDLALLSHCDNLGRYTSSPPSVRHIDIQEISGELLTQEKETEMNSLTIELLVGVSNSGKTTYTSRRIEEGFDGVVISRDALVMKHGKGETYNACWDSLSSKQQDKINEELDNQFLEAVKNKKHIIVDMMNLSRRSRQLWLGRIPVHYHKKATLFLTPYSEILHRNEGQKCFKYLKREILDGMVKRFEYPLYDEIDELKCIETNMIDHG